MNLKKYIKESIKYVLRSSLLTAPYVREFDRLYEMSDSELRDWQEKRFLKIFRKAYTKSPFYKEFYSQAGINIDDIKSIDDIKKLPILTKEIVRREGKRLLTCSDLTLISNHTSGSTGSPLTVWESWPALWKEQAYFECSRKRWGFSQGESIVSLRGNLERQDISLKVHINNTLYLSSYNINEANAQMYYDLIVKHKPRAIEGYPSSLYTLATILKVKGLRLQIPLAFTSSETLLDYQRALINEYLAVDIYDHYGTTERTIRLCENLGHNGYYEVPGYSINEYVDDSIITTSLINDAFPLIRYQVNDIVEIDTSASTGKPFIKSISGRKEDYLICKDGTRIMRLGFITKDAKHVKYTQIVQDEKGLVHIRIVPELGFKSEDGQAIVNALNKRAGEDNLDVTFDIISEADLEYTNRGKFKYIINQMQN